MPSISSKIVASLGCSLAILAACSHPAGSGAVSLRQLRLFESREQIVDCFQKSGFPLRTTMLDRDGRSWCCISVYPPSGVGEIDVFCYSKESGSWALRGATVILNADTTALDYQATANALSVLHRGSNVVTCFR